MFLTLIKKDYRVSWGNEVSNVTCLYNLQPVFRQAPKQQSLTTLSCTDISWNSSGFLVGASYGRVDLVGWCFERGYLCVWNLLKRSTDSSPFDSLEVRKPDFTIEVESYLMCIEFHPEKPNLIAGGTYNGCVQVWNLSQLDGEDNLLGSSGSRINSLSHRDPVTCVRWVQNKRDDAFMVSFCQNPCFFFKNLYSLNLLNQTKSLQALAAMEKF